MPTSAFLRCGDECNTEIAISVPFNIYMLKVLSIQKSDKLRTLVRSELKDFLIIVIAGVVFFFVINPYLDSTMIPAIPGLEESNGNTQNSAEALNELTIGTSVCTPNSGYGAAGISGSVFPDSCFYGAGLCNGKLCSDTVALGINVEHV